MQSEADIRQLFIETLSRIDIAFREQRANDMGAFFSGEARLLWPAMSDIVGREAIQSAFNQFAANFQQFSYQPERVVIDIQPPKAYCLGHFTETRRPKTGGPITKIFGRLVEFWQLEPDGEWRILWLLTSRYAEDQVLPAT